MTLLILYVGFALGVSFLCSTLEAALLSVRMATLVEKAGQGVRGAQLLLALKRKRIDDAISAILILNTISNTLGATLAGAQAAKVFGDPWIGVFSGVMTLAILVFSEIIPKTLGTAYNVALVPFVGVTLHVLTRLMAPALVVSRALTRRLARGGGTGFSRGELAAVIETASRDGALSPAESTIFENLLRVRDVQVEDVMTPRTVMFAMPANATVGDLMEKPQSEAYSRIPLFQGDPDNVVGYVLIRDVLRALATGGAAEQPLSRFRREVRFVPEKITVETALRQVLEQREPIAMVTDEHGGISGLVTLEDLTETVLGVEIVDESDQVADLRRAAAELRDRRLERMRIRLARASGESELPAE